MTGADPRDARSDHDEPDIERSSPSAGSGSDEGGSDSPGTMGRWDEIRTERLERLESHGSRLRVSVARVIDRVEEHLPEPVTDVVERIRRRDTFLLAGGLAFSSLISTIPALVVVAWITGSVLGTDRTERLAGRVDELAPTDLTVEPFVRSLLQVGTGVGLLALIAALWPATAFGSAVARAFDAMADDDDPTLHGLRGRARALLVIVVVPVFVIGAFVAAWVATGLLGDGVVGTAVGWTTAFVSGVVISWAATIALFRWFGHDETPWRAQAIGAAVTAVGVVAASLGYLVYLSYGADWEERVAGSGVSAAVLFTFWLFLVNVLLLVGYATSVVLGRHHER